MAVVKNFRLKKNFYKKLCLPFITLNKKYLSKQVVPITYTLERTFFAVATLEGLRVVSFHKVATNLENLEKCQFLTKIRENLEKSGEKFESQGKVTENV